MSELENKIVLHVIGETDFVSYVYPVDVFLGCKGVFGTEEGDKYIQWIGSFMSEDNWSEIAEQSDESGMTYGELLGNLLVSVFAGTKTLEHALDNGFNLVALTVFRATGDNDEAPAFGARMAGAMRTDSLDTTEHAKTIFGQAPYLAPMFLEDIREGLLSPRSAFIDYFNLPRDAVDTAIAAHAHPTANTSADALPVSVFFHEMEVEGAAEPIIVCTADPDLAARLTSVERLAISLVSAVIPTPHGGAGYWLWKVGVGTPHAFLVEQFLDIHDQPNAYYERLKAMEYVRFVLINRMTRETARIIFLPTDTLSLESFEAIAQTVADVETSYNFQAACGHVINTVDPNEFFEQEMSRVAT